ncbi:hypothetical protein GF325_14710 [Candidatus Bathyarchaeota archaeon]|nr:hypothetical protein [Candidatus Bathyarchaeota archaeon]
MHPMSIPSFHSNIFLEKQVRIVIVIPDKKCILMSFKSLALTAKVTAFKNMALIFGFLGAIYAIMMLVLGGILKINFLRMMGTIMGGIFGIIFGICLILYMIFRKKYKEKVASGEIKKEEHATGGGFIANAIQRQMRLVSSIQNAMSDQQLSGLDESAKRVIALVTLHPKISLKKLAERVKMNEDEIEELLADLVMRKLIKGHIDPGTREFISSMYQAGSINDADGDGLANCPHCGASLLTAPLRGTTTKCSSCGNLIVHR